MHQACDPGACAERNRFKNKNRTQCGETFTVRESKRFCSKSISRLRDRPQEDLHDVFLNQDVFGESRRPAMHSPARLQGSASGHNRDQKEAVTGRRSGGGIRSNSDDSELGGRAAVAVPHRLEEQEASQDEQQTAGDLP